jgi:hypothetical protein
MVNGPVKIRPLYIMLLTIILTLSCDESFRIVSCDDCLTSEPTEATIRLEVDATGVYGASIWIYEGNINDSILMRTDNVYGEYLEFLVVVNKKYTFRIDYNDRNGTRYTAINSVYPRVKLELEQCPDFPCYYIYDYKLNMKLKYQ